MRNKHLFIATHAKNYTVSTSCRLLDVSRSWFYGFQSSQPERQARAQHKERRDGELAGLIRTIFQKCGGCYGSERIHAQLKAQGEVVSERRVARIMKDNGISPQRRGPMVPVTTLSNHKKSPSANLLQREFDRYTPTR